MMRNEKNIYREGAKSAKESKIDGLVKSPQNGHCEGVARGNLS
jgi:hypothetical protein